MSDNTQKPTKQKTQTPPPGFELIKPHLKPYGQIRLSAQSKRGRTVRARVDTQEGVLAVIKFWRGLGYTSIEVSEPPKYGVAQFWDIQEVNKPQNKKRLMHE